jgi:hypothetical protein
MVAVQTTPKVRKPQIQVLADEELKTLFQYLKDRPLYMPVLLAASTGMRRGEILGLRWCDLDFDRSTLQIAQVVEALKESISIKEPKTEQDDRPARDPRAGAEGSPQSASRALPQTRMQPLRVGVPDVGWEADEPAPLHEGIQPRGDGCEDFSRNVSWVAAHAHHAPSKEWCPRPRRVRTRPSRSTSTLTFCQGSRNRRRTFLMSPCVSRSVSVPTRYQLRAGRIKSCKGIKEDGWPSG